MFDLSIEKSVNNCTFVKTVLMLMVILGHSVNFWNGTWFTVYSPVYESAFLKILSLFINSFHVYAFALTSGYLFAFLTIEKKKYRSISSLLKKKVLRLIIPYFFVCIMWVIPIAYYFYHYSIQEMIWKYILGTNPNQLWFLLMLFWVFVIAWGLSRLKKNTLFNCSICILIYGVGVVLSHLFPNVFCIWTACEHFIYFWVGYEIFLHHDCFFNNNWFLWDACFVVLFVFYVLCPSGIIKSSATIVLHLIGAIAAFLSLQFCATKRIHDNLGLIKWLSQYMMPMYLFHQQLIYFSIVLFNGKVNPYIHSLLNYVVAFSGSLIISIIMMKWKPTRFLIGEKC